MNETVSPKPKVTVIIPARNEESNIGRCLESLVTQPDVELEIIVVNDHSVDQTREIAATFAGVNVIEARPLEEGWTGKANAIWTAIPHAKGDWLIFTDADTCHKPGSLARSVEEASRQDAHFLSYSPAQETGGWWERLIQPLIFAELNMVFDYADVSNPASEVAAANGQYILCKRDRYNEIGGHAAVAGSLLEDVELARLAKRQGKIIFRFAPDAVTCRMYRDFSELRDGWSKNLALLFPDSMKRAVRRAAECLCLWFGPPISIALLLKHHVLTGGILAAVTFIFYSLFMRRIRRAGYGWGSLTSVLGLPALVYLLSRSSRHHRLGMVSWKGRNYGSRRKT